ncbi:SIR2 family protein [Burkholderia cenocepacia]|uniref:SIR2 family protein n=1 Tax=Burkholderia cenocepacia TaxID=95486 RepID=A0AAW4TNY4_9BURK|nr:SIR2 family protein [Burkholderia cenocepacia]MCA8383849.1 SIR2 family protein [Burkholderia cenocepacia]
MALYSNSSSDRFFVQRRQIADAYNFETFVLELLRNHASKQGKKFEIGGHGAAAFDGYAPDGFDDMKSPVIVECMQSFSRRKFRTDITRIRDWIDARSHIEKQTNHITVLFVVDKPLESDELSIESQKNDPLLDGIEIRVWSWSDLEKIVDKDLIGSREILGNLFPLRVRNIVINSEADWRQEQKSRLATLAERFSDGQCSLFLGAGVSSSAGMPDWKSLLNALFVTYLTGSDTENQFSENETLELVERMDALDSPSALVSARYLRKAIAVNSDEGGIFTGAIRKALYGLRKDDKESPLIKVLVEMCIPRRSGALVSSVITYNFDDLLERELKSKSVLYKCIYTPTEPPDVDELPVYHVHGFVPEDAGDYVGVNDTTLVFSEEGYHQIYTDSYHWSNLAQLNALRNSTCIMVGLSMSDPNLRRLLEISQRGFSDPRHFAFMRRTSSEKFGIGDADSSPITVAPEKVKSFLTRHYATTEALMRELGVVVVWFERFEELPELLNSVGFPTRTSIPGK